MANNVADGLGDRRCDQEKNQHEQQDSPGGRQVDGALGHEIEKDCQQQHAENVVEHHGAEHDVALAAVRAAEVGQGSHGDADAGRGHRARHHQRDQQVESKNIAGEDEAGEQRQQETPDRDDYRFIAGTGQFADVGLQPDLEQQQNDADLGQHLDQPLRLDKSQQAGAEDDAGDDFADDHRHFQRVGHLPEKPGGDQDRGHLQDRQRGIHECLSV